MTMELFKMVFNVCPVLLKPVIRILLSAGINYKQYSKISRRLFVEVGLEDFDNANGQGQNISRTSIITGISRSEVRKIKSESMVTTADKENVFDREIEGQLNSSSKILYNWHILPSYQDNDGKPLVLSLTSNTEPSFKHLMTTYGGDLKSGTMLKELLKVKAVEKVSEEQLRVLKRYYMPLPGDGEHILRAAQVIAEFAVSVHHNMMREVDEPSRFESRAYNTSIPVKYVPEFQEFMEDKGMLLLESIDDWLTERELKEGQPVQPITRLGAGIYITEQQNTKTHEDSRNV